MEVIPAGHGTQTFMISFRRGEYIIEGLREFLTSQGIDAALITSGIGSLDRCRIHTITNTGLPPEERYLTLEGPLEVGSLQGSVAGGEPHIHVVLHDVGRDVKYVGHLEEGSRCCFRVEMGLIAFTDVRTERRLDPETKLVDIVAVDKDER